MSNEITAYFKGRTGVAESVYQYDYGMILVFDGIDLPATFDCYFSNEGDEESIPVIGSDNRAAIPNSCLSVPGIITAHIPLQTGLNDSEVEYVVTVKVINRARPADNGTEEERSAISEAIAALNHNNLPGLVPDIVTDWLEDHPEATTTVQDGAITDKKLSSELKNCISPLSSFDGETAEEKLFNALITDGFRGSILCGNIEINTSISIPLRSYLLREVKIENAIITLNEDMFTTPDTYARIPSFVNCKFIGNGHAIFGGDYVVAGNFIGCSFDDCSIINNASGTVQNVYLSNCEIVNDTVPFIKAEGVYDCRIISTLCESQNATLIDTFDSNLLQGGSQNIWICDSSFESFQNTVLKLSGGSVYLHNCYFEANADGCLHIKKNASALDMLMLEISGCKINQSVTAFEIEDFTNNYRVKISIHDNYYYTAVSGTPMVVGVPSDNMLDVYNNRPTYQADVISDTPRFEYASHLIKQPTLAKPEWLTLYSGGYVQFGAIVFVNMVVKAMASTGGGISSAITGLPKSSIANAHLNVYDNVGALLDKHVIVAGTVGRFNGGLTADDRYTINGFYFTDNKTVR